MNTFEITEQVVDGKVLINLPEEYNNKMVKITVLPEDDFGDEKDWANLPSHKKVELLKRFTGSAKYPDVETNKYDVYDQ